MSLAEGGGQPSIGFPFPALISFLRGAAVVVSIDTSIAHLSGALGVPTVGLYGPTSSKRWGAMGERVVAVDSPTPGCGYMNWGADSDRKRAGLPCMETISFEEVAARVDSLLDRYAESSC